MERKIRRCKTNLQSKIILEGKTLDNAYRELKSEYEELDSDSSWFEALDTAKAQLNEEQKGIERLGHGRSLRGQRPTGEFAILASIQDASRK